MLQYPQVALEFMNRDHAEFVALRKHLLNQLSPGESLVEGVDNLLDELLVHTRAHFAEEERRMLETGFPPYPVHKNEHDSVLAEMAAKCEEWKRSRDRAALRDWADRRLGDWFVNHVSTMDFVTAQYVASHQTTR